jgi:hypothetical protein
MDTLIPKFAISIALSAIFLFFLFNKSKLASIVGQKENIFFAISLFLFRFLPIIIIFLIFKFDAHSDVAMFYDWAKSAKEGYMVYRDFKAPYAPLFSYITAIPLFFYNHVNSILLLMVIIESIILIVSYQYFSKKNTKFEAFFHSILYLTLPAPFILAVLGGQEDIWMWGVIIGMLVVYNKNNDSFLAGIILGIGMIVTKVLFVFSLPIAFILLPKKVRLLAGLSLIGLPTLAILIYFGGDSFLLPIQEANNPRNPNIWSIINPILNVYEKIGIKNLNQIGLYSNIILTIYLSFKAKINKIPFEKAFPLIWIFSNCWLMFIQQSSLSNYCFVFLMPLLFIFGNIKNTSFMLVTLLFSIACSVQPPIWWGQGMPTFKSLNDIAKPINMLEYGLEIFIVGCIIYFCNIITKTLLHPKSPNGAN